MTPGARIQAAIELLDRIETPQKGEEALPADAVVNSYFRSRRYIGAKDRRAIGDAVFQALRRTAYFGENSLELPLPDSIGAALAYLLADGAAGRGRVLDARGEGRGARDEA